MIVFKLTVLGIVTWSSDFFVMEPCNVLFTVNMRGYLPQTICYPCCVVIAECGTVSVASQAKSDCGRL